MKKLAAIVFGFMFGLCLALPVTAAPPTTARCKADKDCSAPSRCVKTEGGRSCAQPCEPKPGTCPQDQRCVKDGPSFVCRPINDAVGL
jgi:hypothetical protein